MVTISTKKILRTWWPLAASWLLMSLEGPLVNAIIARLPDPEINLAGFGSVSEPLRSFTSAPLIMLLAASVALTRDWKSYLKIKQFTWIVAGIMTLTHILIAFTPLYYVVVRGILGVPEEIIPISRIGLMITVPLPWAIGYRRFNQGIMIRYGYSNAVIQGTFIRLFSVSSVLLIGYILGSFTGIVVGAAALTAGMFAEALFCGWRVRPILKFIPKGNLENQELTWKSFILFYLPLVLTSILNMIWRPIGSAAISRMPDALSSLAVWPVLSSLVYMYQTIGISYNEVVVALLDTPGSFKKLRNFALAIIIGISLLFLLVVCTPASTYWFKDISALPDDLVNLAKHAIWFMLPVPAGAVIISWFQGAILWSKKTRSITEAVIVFLLVIILILGAGIIYGNILGLYVGSAAFSIAMVIQMFWLWFRSKPALATARERDQRLPD